MLLSNFWKGSSQNYIRNISVITGGGIGRHRLAQAIDVMKLHGRWTVRTDTRCVANCHARCKSLSRDNLITEYGHITAVRSRLNRHNKTARRTIRAVAFCLADQATYF